VEADGAEAHFRRGHAAHLAGDLGAAVQAYEAALAADPRHDRSLQNLGHAYAATGEAERGLACLQRAVAAAPGHAPHHANLAVALRRRGDLAASLARYAEAIRLDPTDARTRYHHALTLLLAGDFARGWVEHEWRARVPGFPVRHDLLAARPLWTGGRLRGARLLLHAEQGLGDTLQFVRYAAAMPPGGTVALMVQPALAELLRPMAGMAAVVPAGGAVPGHDVQAPLLSLPLLTRRWQLAGTAPYLQASAERRRRWAAALPRGGLRVGLAWSGNPTHGHDRDRSLPAEAARRLARTLLAAHAGLRLFGLQIGERAGDLDGVNPRYVSLAPGIADFADTAAILTELDAVVTVDTSVAHLAGGLGRPAIVLLPFAPDWRWGTQGTRTPWYATLRLCRAAGPGAMEGAFSQAATALARLS